MAPDFDAIIVVRRRANWSTAPVSVSHANDARLHQLPSGMGKQVLTWETGYLKTRHTFPPRILAIVYRFLSKSMPLIWEEYAGTRKITKHKRDMSVASPAARV